MMMRPPDFTFDQVEMSYLDALEDAENDRQDEIVLARRYFEGDHDIELTDRVKEFLGLHGNTNEPRLNVCRTIITAITERLTVIGFNTGEDVNEEGIRPVADWAWTVWQANRMDAKADDVHEGALRDGEFFVVVDWDTENKRPRLTPHQRWTDPANQGDGFGIRMVYPDNNPALDPLYAVKEWAETYRDGDKYETRRRRTIYLPDRVERYVYEGQDWQQYIDNPEDDWPIKWVDKAGKPLGVAAKHFKNKSLRSEIWDAIPIQDGTNKSFIDTMAAADLTAFRVYVALGWIPTTDGQELAADGSNALKIAPGQIIGTKKQGAGFQVVEPANIQGLMNLTQQLVMWTAMITDTPLSRFLATRQIASEGTLKEQGEPLESKAANRQALFGNGWEDVMDLARRLENTYGSGDIDTEPTFSTQWYSRRSLDELAKKKSLGVPTEQLWEEAGYSPEQVQKMKESPEYQAMINMLAMGLENTQPAGGEGENPSPGPGEGQPEDLTQ